MHWCQLETEALFLLLTLVPCLGVWARSLHAKWHHKHSTECDHKDHNDNVAKVDAILLKCDHKDHDDT